MSGFAAEPERTHEQDFSIHTSYHAESAGLQHDEMFQNTSDDSKVAREQEDADPPEVDITATQKMLSAISGSLLTSLLVTPLDVVRVRLQSQTSPKPYSLPLKDSPAFKNLPSNLGVTACCREVFWVTNTSPFCVANPATSSPPTFTTLNPSTAASSSSAVDTTAANCAADASRQKSFNSTFDGLRKIARNEGALSLWRGLSPTLLMAIPGNVIYFTGYDTLRSNSHSPIRQHVPEAYIPLVAGSVARVAAAAVVSPVEMFRTRLQAATTTGTRGFFVDTLKGLGHLAQTEGYSSLWRGLTLTMWRDVPFSGLYWWGYEAVRDKLQARRGVPAGLNHRSHDQVAIFIDSFIAGAASGAFASVITTPFDVGKTRRQVFEHEMSQNSKAQQHPAIAAKGGGATLKPEEMPMPRFLYHIWRNEGVTGLFRGWTARCLKVAPACAIMISSYEIGKKWAHHINERKRDAERTDHQQVKEGRGKSEHCDFVGRQPEHSGA